MISRFLRGFRSPFDGFRLIVANAGFWRLATIPFIIDLILFCAGVWLGFRFLPEWIPQFGVGTWWGPFVYIPLRLISYFVFFILLFGAVLLSTNLIAAPFNTMLAEKTLVHIGALDAKKFAVGRWVRVSSHMLVISLIRAVVFVTVAVILFVVSLIPGLNIIAAFAGLLMMSFDCADFAFEAQERGLKSRLALYREKLAEFSGFATALGLTIVIPGLNLLLYPATVAGAALLVASFDRKPEGQKIDSKSRS